MITFRRVTLAAGVAVALGAVALGATGAAAQQSAEQGCRLLAASLWPNTLDAWQNEMRAVGYNNCMANPALTAARVEALSKAFADFDPYDPQAVDRLKRRLSTLPEENWRLDRPPTAEPHRGSVYACDLTSDGRVLIGGANHPELNHGFRVLRIDNAAAPDADGWRQARCTVIPGAAR
jgi:hypothetical protein